VSRLVMYLLCQLILCLDNNIMAGVQPMIARIFDMAGDAPRQKFRSAIIQTIRDEQGNGPYGLEGEARIAVGRK
jgi:hypothetical protein